jgi:hypothetical protein
VLLARLGPQPAEALEAELIWIDAEAIPQRDRERLRIRQHLLPATRAVDEQRLRARRFDPVVERALNYPGSLVSIPSTRAARRTHRDRSCSAIATR